MPDFIVVGLGAVGSAVAHHLARRGARVLGLDRFHPPHDRGSSHGRTRITRLAIGEGAAYVPLVRRSHALWRELEQEGLAGDAPLYRRTGGLVIASPAADEAAFHGRSGFFARTVALASEFGIAHELLDARAVRARWPQFLMRDDERAYFEPDAGLLAPERCVAAQLAAAARHGAELRHDEPVLSLQPLAGGGIALRTPRGTHEAAQVVLAAGPWLPSLVGGLDARRPLAGGSSAAGPLAGGSSAAGPLAGGSSVAGPLAGSGIASRLVVQRQVLHWFRTSTPAAFDAARCPVFIWLHGAALADAMYGFPMGDGVDGVKVACEQTALRTDPEAIERQVAPAEIDAMFETHVRGRVAGIEPVSAATATCMYTSTADGHFIVEPAPGWPGLTLVSACSGHGFKHSAGLGEAIAQQLLGQVPHASLAPFGGGPR